MADSGGIITNKNTDLTLGISLYQVIQFVTFFSPSWRSRFHLWRGHVKSPSQKGHKEMPGTYKFQIAFVTASQKLWVKNRGTNNKNTIFQALNGAGVFAYMETYTLRPTPSIVPMNVHQRDSIQYLSMELSSMFDSKTSCELCPKTRPVKRVATSICCWYSAGLVCFFLQNWVVDFF